MEKITFQKVGTDAEVFFVHKMTKKPIPVIGLVGGTKENPKPIPLLNKQYGNGCAIQEDNVMAEFNIPPCGEPGLFMNHIHVMRNWLTKEAEKHDCKLRITGSARFEKEQLFHEQAQTFGCEPDFCVWTRSENQIDRSLPDLETLRTAAAHVHVSFLEGGKKPSLEAKEFAVMMLDLHLGVPSVLLDDDVERRKVYGKAGAFRIKDYGVEHRVMSNYWIRENFLVQWVFQQTQLAIARLNDKAFLRFVLDSSKQIQEAINNCDKEQANVLVRSIGINLPC